MHTTNAPIDLAPIILQASRAQLSAMIAHLSARGFADLTPTFALVMPLLDATGMRSSILAQRTGVTKQAMSQLVRLLEQRGYVEQAPDPSDSRAKVVRLTKHGVALRNACEEVREELHAKAVAVLGKRDLRQLQKSLSRLVESLTAWP